MKNLYKKMQLIMNETEAIEKNLVVGAGSNSYKAVSEAAVLNVIKPLLKKHGVILFPVKIDAKETVDTYSTKYGDSSRLMTQVIATYKIVDTETGESELLQTIGNGVDTQDKASGKAMTYAYKVLLQKTFMLFSGEDTDNEHSEDITVRQTRPQSRATTQSSTAIVTQAQLKRMYAIGLKKGIKPESINHTILKDYDRKPEEMDRAMYNRLIDRLERANK